MNHLKNFKIFEGKIKDINNNPFNDPLSTNKKDLIKKKLKDHIKSISGLEISQVGNDLSISDGVKSAKIIFKDNYVGIKKDGQKFIDKLGYNEFGKIRLKINDLFIKYEVDQDEVIEIMKGYGWGDSVVNNLEDFENSEFYNNPKNDDEYAKQFDEFMIEISGL